MFSAIWKQPLLQAMCTAGKLRAWTGGTRPAPLLSLSAEERETVSAMFREQLADWASFWREPPPTDVLRTFWRRARYDAHATHRQSAT